MYTGLSFKAKVSVGVRVWTQGPWTHRHAFVVSEVHDVVFQRLHHLMEPRNRRELKIHNARHTVRLNGGGQGAYV